MQQELAHLWLGHTEPRRASSGLRPVPAGPGCARSQFLQWTRCPRRKQRARPPAPRTWSPERDALLLVGLADAVVAVAVQALARVPVMQVHVGRAVGAGARAELREVAGIAGVPARRSRRFQLKRQSIVARAPWAGAAVPGRAHGDGRGSQSQAPAAETDPAQRALLWGPPSATGAAKSSLFSGSCNIRAS